MPLLEPEDGAPPASRLPFLSDLRWPLAWGALALFLGSLPYLLTWARTPPGFEFTGILIHPADGFSYLAKMRQGWDGAALFRMAYTTEESAPAPLFLFYLFRGLLARTTGLSLIEVYHLFRIGEAAVMLAAFWDLLGLLCPDGRSRRAAYVIGALGAGLGWLALPFRLIAPDLSVPEGWLFFSLLANPHFPAALACYAMAVSFAARAVAQRSLLWTAAGALTCFAAVLVHPFLWLPLALVFVALLGVTRPHPSYARAGAPLAVILTAGALAAGVQTYPLLTDPVLAAWTAQNRLPTPPPHEVLLGYGTTLALAVIALTQRYVKRNAKPVPRGVLLAVIWLGFGVALLYAPLAFQRRYFEGIQFPLAALAGMGFALLWERGSRMRLLAVMLLLLALPSTLLNVALPVLGTTPATATAYLPRGDRAAYDWLAANATRADVVLAGPVHSNQIPAYSPARVVWGHPFETIDGKRKRLAVQELLSGDGSDNAAQFLREQGVTLVLLGEEELKIGQLSERFLEQMEQAFAADGVTVSRFKQPAQ